MPFSLFQLSHQQMTDIAHSRRPTGLASSIEDESLPPTFVASRSLAQIAQGKSAYWCATFLIIRNADNTIVGGCGFKDEPIAGRVEIGYGIAPACRRQGAASHAVAALMALAYAGGATEVLAEILPDNFASAELARRLGFIDTGTRLDEEDDTVVLWVASKITKVKSVATRD
jgi:ribosomal-protein-alanine N-acetyltransferase